MAEKLEDWLLWRDRSCLHSKGEIAVPKQAWATVLYGIINELHFSEEKKNKKLEEQKTLVWERICKGRRCHWYTLSEFELVLMNVWLPKLVYYDSIGGLGGSRNAVRGTERALPGEFSKILPTVTSHGIFPLPWPNGTFTRTRWGHLHHRFICKKNSEEEVQGGFIILESQTSLASGH